MASKILFDWKLNDGFDGALFFGSAFGGAFCGAVLGGVVMNRLYRWRQGGEVSSRTAIGDRRVRADRDR